MSEVAAGARIGCVLLVALLLHAFGATAQTAPVLLADRIDIDAQARTLTATGNVEVFYEGTRLTAARARYVDGADSVLLTGPIALTAPDGRSVILADAAELSADLQNGLLTGARMLLEQEVQLAAARVERIDGRYTRLGSSVATACRICAGGGPPIWELRASEVVHDQQERQLYLRNVGVRAFGVPIAWLPRLRLPDPSVERLTGFLVPRWRSGDNLGFGVKLPWFRTLGPHADLLLTPWVTTTDSTTLEYRFRRAFAAGDVTFTGAVSRDSLTDDPWRSYLFAKGAFSLSDDWRLRFDVNLASDPGYLLEYDYSDADRLDSRLSLEHVGAERYAAAEVIGFQSLRDDAIDANSPVAVADALWLSRFSPAALGGTAQVAARIDASLRDGSGTGDAARDTLRLSSWADWRRDWRLASGMRAGIVARVDGDLYLIANDDRYDETVLRFSPRIAAEWRWPLIRRDASAIHLLEPVAQLVWAGQQGGSVPNDDSVLVEFDETNLFALNRFPGRDRVETGMFANLGLRYSRRGASGLPLRLAFGRVLRMTDREQFSGPTGLDGFASDWVAAAHLPLSPSSEVIGRAVFDDRFALSKSELRLGLDLERFDLATSFLWIEEDPAEDMTADMSEWAFDAGWQISPFWRARAGWRYDAVDGEPTRARFGLIYANECIAVEFSARRRFTESRGVSPSTDLSLQLSFDGFGDDGPRPQTRSCRPRA